MEREVTGRGWMPLGIIIAIILAILFSVYVVDLLGTIDEQRHQLNVLKRDNADLANALLGRTVHVVSMYGSQRNARAFGKVVWDSAGKNAFLQVSHLPPSPPSKNYQLWIIHLKKPDY